MKTPQLLTRRVVAAGVELDLHVPAGIDWFAGHFPRVPMLPGVVQVAWAIALGREHLDFQGPVRRLELVKFQHPILPRSDVTLALERRSATELAFTYRGALRTCSSGRLVAVPA